MHNITGLTVPILHISTLCNNLLNSTTAQWHALSCYTTVTTVVPLYSKREGNALPTRVAIMQSVATCRAINVDQIADLCKW